MKGFILFFIFSFMVLTSCSKNKDTLLKNDNNCLQVYKDSISKHGFYIPANINECNQELDTLLQHQPKKLLIETKDIELKRIRGMLIFSEWFEEECTRLCCYFNTKGIDSHEDMEYLILLSYKRYLLKQDFEFDTECKKIVTHHDSIKAKYEAKRKKQSEVDSIDGIYIPKDLDDCLLELDKILDNTIKTEIKKAENTDNFHFGLGLWIRNNWGLWGGSRLWHWFYNQEVSHPDDISGAILSTYQEYLQKGQINTKQKLQEVKDEYKKFENEIQSGSNNIFFDETPEENFYSDEYKDFIKRRYIDNIYINR